MNVTEAEQVEKWNTENRGRHMSEVDLRLAPGEAWDSLGIQVDADGDVWGIGIDPNKMHVRVGWDADKQELRPENDSLFFVVPEYQPFMGRVGMGNFQRLWIEQNNATEEEFKERLHWEERC